MIGQTLNKRYRITSQLGKGAMGLVYRATDRHTQQDVAIKVIARELALEADMLARFRREGEALRQLRHRNIVAFVEMFEHQGQQMIVMEYVPGGSLHDVIRRSALDVRLAAQIALDLSDALASAHRLDIIHRDIKPENVLLGADGTPKLTDFGVARLLGAGTRLTGTGTQVGTPYYMSPEAWEGKPLDAQADVWSLGVVLYEMLTGQVPFGGETVVAVMNKVLTAPLPEIVTVRPEVPPVLVGVVERMLTRDKATRFETMRQVAVDLERAEKEARLAQMVAQRKAEQAHAPQTRQVEIRRKQEEEAGKGEEGRGEKEEGRKEKDEARQAQEGRRAQETRLKEEEAAVRTQQAGEEAREKQEKALATQQAQEEARRRQAEARRPEEVRRAAEKARLKQQSATRLPKDYVPRELVGPGVQTPEPTAQAGRGPSGRAMALIGAGVLAVICLLAAGGLGLWAGASRILAPAASATGTPSSTAAPSATAAHSAPISATIPPPPPTSKPATATPSPNVPTMSPLPARTLSVGTATVSNMDGMTLVYVPAGQFIMGSADSDSDANPEEKPEHTVFLDAYSIDLTDVTNAMFAKCVLAGNCQAPSPPRSQTRDSYYGNASFANHPVINVSWNDASAYCVWAGRRLPTEAEWEKAARGTDGRKYPWGNTAPWQMRLNFSGLVGDTSAVGNYPAGASPYGVLDMAGNVRQWVADWYSATYYASSPDRNPAGPASGTARVLRGGSWFTGASGVRAAIRARYYPDYRDYLTGFRCATSR
jgi:formylglycine-generating enzyme required for sulfatase activity